ncbi:hypothetical protein E2C01_002868 [Portunus trituberculatus]|uniref:Uncharacterized protein n=1 Tax=Portunus trituberculatus TaxID=210409 RepID=A0A5B7CLW3_PORTR|nr:hypothetical protein [Portunus trituberculatus]
MISRVLKSFVCLTTRSWRVMAAATAEEETAVVQWNHACFAVRGVSKRTGSNPVHGPSVAPRRVLSVNDLAREFQSLRRQRGGRCRWQFSDLSCRI